VTAALTTLGSYAMRFSKQFFGGIIVGLALGMFVGSALADGKKEVNYTSLAGVGMLLVIAGVAMARAGPPKSWLGVNRHVRS